MLGESVQKKSLRTPIVCPLKKERGGCSSSKETLLPSEDKVKKL